MRCWRGWRLARSISDAAAQRDGHMLAVEPPSGRQSMQQPHSPVVGPVLLALVAVLSSLAYVTGTVTVTRSEFAWRAGQTEPVPLVLAAQAPETIDAQGPCSAASSPEPVDLVSTGEGGSTLGLRGQDGQVWMTFAGAQVGQILPAPPDCRVSMTYARADNTAVLTSGGQTSSAALAPLSVEDPVFNQFAVTGLYAAPGFEAVVTTQPTTFSSSNWRAVLLMLCLGSLLGLALVLRSDRAAPTDPIRAARWTGSDTLVAAVGLVALVVVPPRYDDGWVLTTVRQYTDLGYFSNYYSIDAVAQPQGFWWAWIERLWLTPLGTPGFLLRLPTVFILLGTWWFLRRHVLSRLDLEPATVWGAAAVAAAGMVGLQVTIRPEPIVALLLVAAISVVVRYATTREPYLLVLLAALSAFALAAHQTGWAVVAASVAALPWSLEWLRRPRAWITAVAIAVTGVAVLLTLLMLGSNMTLWWRSVRAFAADTGTYQSWLDEGDRIGSLAEGISSPPVTTAVVGILILSILGFLLRARRDDVNGRAAGWAALAAVGGLFLTSSKLIDHYGAVVPAAVVLTALGLRGIRQPIAAGAAIAVGLVGVVGLLQAGTWALALDRVTQYVPGPWPWVAAGLLVVVIAAVVGGLIRGRVPALQAVVGALAGTLLVTTTAALGPVVIDGTTQPGSWFGQQLGVISGRTCGALDVIDLARPSLTSLTLPRPLSGPTVELGRDPGAWVKGPLFSPIRVGVETGDGVVTTQTIPPSGEIWGKVSLPPDATSVTSVQEGVTVVTAQAVPSEPAADDHAGDPAGWWVEPGVALQVPCVQSASIRDGVVDAAISVGRPAWVARGLVTNSVVAYEAGCVGTAPGVRGVCLVALPATGDRFAGEVVREAVG